MKVIATTAVTATLFMWSAFEVANPVLKWADYVFGLLFTTSIVFALRSKRD